MTRAKIVVRFARATSAGLKTTQIALTDMACEKPRMQRDDWLARLLGDVALTLHGDTLTLSDGTIRLTQLDREVATPDEPIEGSHWILDGILSGDAVSSVPAGVTASIRIAGGGSTSTLAATPAAAPWRRPQKRSRSARLA